MKQQIWVAGLVPFTTIDYPGCLAAVIFCQGCPWKCHYCHNAHLQPMEVGGTLSWEKTLQTLVERKHFLDAVVFSGGEPTLQPALPGAMAQVRELGLKVGLHTAGTHPLLLKEALKQTDWVGMDIKAPFSTYEKVTQIPRSGVHAKRSAETLLASGVDYEFRTTVQSDLLSTEDLWTLSNELKALGAKTFVLQRARPNGSFTWDAALLDHLRASFTHFSIRE